MSHRSFVLTAVLALALVGDAPRAMAAAGPEALPFMQSATTPATAECSGAALDLLGVEGVPEPIFMSCTASATCYNGTTVNCSVGTGSCTGVNAACPSQRGYVQCGATTTYCPACPTVVGFGCSTVSCTNDAQCTAICPDPEQGGLCQACTPHSSRKTCFCLA